MILKAYQKHAIEFSNEAVIAAILDFHRLNRIESTVRMQASFQATRAAALEQVVEQEGLCIFNAQSLLSQEDSQRVCASSSLQHDCEQEAAELPGIQSIVCPSIRTLALESSWQNFTSKGGMPPPDSFPR